MKKKHLIICNKSLLALAPIVLATGLLLDCVPGPTVANIGKSIFTWIHIVSSIAVTALVVWHMKLNWGAVSGWIRRYRQHRSKSFKFTALFFAITAFTGLVCIPLWLSHGHIGFGGVHGKLGFIAAIFIIFHILQHRKWFKGK